MSDFAQQCINAMIAYAQLEKENLPNMGRVYSLVVEDEVKEETRAKLIAQKDGFREQVACNSLIYNPNPITLERHSAWHILTPCLIIPVGSRRPEHILLLSQMLTIFFKAEEEKDDSSQNQHDRNELHYTIGHTFSDHFANHLLHLHDSGFSDYIAQLRDGCERAPSFIKYLMLCVAVEAEKQNNKKVYWQLWALLSQSIQAIAIKDASRHNEYKFQTDIAILSEL